MPPALPIDRPVVFPLFGVRDGRCACGNPNCGAAGKHPRVPYRELRYGDPVPLPEPGAGAGLKTGAAPYGSGVFVVDLDGPEAAQTFDAMGETPETYTVTTPRAEGGWHLYFKHPGFPVKTCAGDLAPNIDIRGDGGIVIAPGSPHKNGGTYDGADTTPVAEAPTWLLDWLRQQKAPSEAQHFPGDVDGEERDRRRGLYAEWLRSDAPARGPALRGQGDFTLFKVVQRGAYDLALPVDDVLELVREHYDPRCDPPWGDQLEERVRHKARDAKENSTRPRAEPLPADLAHLAQQPAPAALPKPVSKSLHFSARIKKGSDWLAPYVRPTYLLEGLIPQSTVCTFFAEGGSVKSWSAFELAISVATGGHWLGRHSVLTGKVLILDFEDGWEEFRRRREILMKRCPDMDLSRLEYLWAGPNLLDPELWTYLEAQGYTLIVIDALSTAMPGEVEENDQRFANGLKIAGRFIEASASSCTIVTVHHANKAGSMRGTSTIRDQSDVVFKFEPVSETDKTKRMRMICDKPGPQKRPIPVNIELSDTGLRIFEDAANDLGRNATGQQDVKAAILRALASPGTSSLVGAALESRIKGDTTAVRKALKELVQEGKVVSLNKFLGYQLDDDEKRQERLLAAAGAKGCNSRVDLARMAKVPAEYVDQAIRDRAIVLRTGKEGGGFLVEL